MAGFKQTEGKLDMDLLPIRALIEVSQVFHYGMLKYSKDNWLKGLKKHELRQAQRRHEAKHDLGQMMDSESGIIHLAHKACLALMELELFIRNKLEADPPTTVTDVPIDQMFMLRFKPPHNIMEEKEKPGSGLTDAEITDIIRTEPMEESAVPFEGKPKC